MNGRVVAVLLTSVVSICVPATAKDETSGAALAGVWSGTMDWTPVGSCSGGDIGVPVLLTLKLEADGSLSGAVERRGALESQWRLHVTSGDRLDAVRTSEASCGDRNGQFEHRQYEVRFKGRIRTDKGQAQLVLEGKDVPCPPIDGYFRTKYTFGRQN